MGNGAMTTQGSVKQKTLKSLFWSFTDNFVTQGSNFFVGLILARLLSPKEFGLIGMIMVFIVISRVFVDSGFSQALIRKKDCSARDYSTVFYFNLLIGFLVYIILFASAGAVSAFYNEPQLVALLRVLGLVLLVNAASFIQKTILTKHIDFKLQTKISIIAAVVSGVIGIGMAYSGWGVWSLVAKTIAQDLIATLLLWLWNKWRPEWTFCWTSFREMFGFGSKLLASSLIDNIYNSIYYVVVGKFYSAVELGYYVRADNFQNLPSSNLNTVIQRVSYPVLATMQDDHVRLKSNYKKLIRNAMFLSFFLMIGMAAMAEPMVVCLVGRKWLPAVPYLQLLCLVGMLYPLHALNLNILNVKGRSDLFLKLEVIKKIISIPPIIMGIFWGIKIMIVGRLVISVISYFLNSFWSGALINYPVKEQIRDITPACLGAFTMGGLLFIAGRMSHLSYGMTFFLQLILGTVIALGVARLIRLDGYEELKRVVVARFPNNQNGPGSRSVAGS